jgi:thioredoxin-dependent peroxiredoxin
MAVSRKRRSLSARVGCVSLEGLLRFEQIAPASRDVWGCLIKPAREDAMMIGNMGRRLALLGLSVMSVMIVAGAAAADLKVGDPAPPFSLKGSDGQTYTLDQFKGKSAVVIAWFPKAFTGGCTKECKSLRENSKPLHDLKVAYFTASVDTPEENEKFAKSLDLDYPILSDPDKTVAKEYGVLNPQRGFANRWTFYIDKAGVIKEIDKKVNAPQAGPDIAAKLKELGLVAE